MTIIKWKKHTGKRIEGIDGFDVIECKNCQFRHVVPIPTTEELEKIYSHEYYTIDKPFYIEKYLEDKDWWNAIYAERFAKIEGYLGKNTGRLLDIGSGPGLFLAHGRSRGWNVKGIEPSRKAYEYSKNVLKLDVENIFLNIKSAKKLGKFDAIHLGEVLEHLPDPGLIIDLVKGLLNPGGILSIVTPNDFNPIQRFLVKNLGFKSWWIKPPHHLNYFCHNTLERFIKTKGFQVLNVSATFPIDLFLVMGEDYIENEKKGRFVHSLRKNFDLNLIIGENADLRNKFLSQLAKIDLGRETVLFAKI